MFRTARIQGFEPLNKIWRRSERSLLVKTGSAFVDIAKLPRLPDEFILTIAADVCLGHVAQFMIPPSAVLERALPWLVAPSRYTLP